MNIECECISCVIKSFLHLVKTYVVISKGQGNLEGLLDVPHNHIYFLLVTKCDLMAKRVGTRKGEFIVKKGIQP